VDLVHPRPGRHHLHRQGGPAPAPHRLGGPAQGITAVHVWVFTPGKDGVHVHTEESWTGDVVTANVTYLQAALDASLHDWLRNLKAKAEYPR
jgi:hypothetical protein